MLVAIRSEDGKRVPRMMRWGLLPHWAKDEKLSYSTFNARAEEFTTKPAFKHAWKWGQRCLVVTDGFYEWKVLDPKGKQKQPYAIAMADDTPMVMAGLWSKWKDPKSGSEVLSCTVLTCNPNALANRGKRGILCRQRRDRAETRLRLFRGRAATCEEFEADRQG
jgi:putative SOS response-associated peptidase YedK